MRDELFFLGIDGGGTGCRARVVDASGAVLGHGQAGPASLRFGADAAWASIMLAASAALGEAGLDASDASIHAAAGIAGLGRKDAMAALQAKPHPFARLSIVSDGLAACVGAHGGADGGVVIAGTGSVGLGRVAGRELRVGGYGFPISDEGSGADMGLEALRSALRAHDRRIAATPLAAEIMARFDGDPFAIVGWADRATATDYATLAPLVVRHAGGGDPEALRIMRAAAASLQTLVDALFVHGVPRVALLGSLAAAIEPWFPEAVRQRLSAPLGDGVDGAVLLARQSVAG